MVDFVGREGSVDQIMVHHDGYRGKLMDTIGLDQRIADIEGTSVRWKKMRKTIS